MALEKYECSKPGWVVIPFHKIKFFTICSFQIFLNFCSYTNQENHNVPESLPQQTVKYNRREREREQSRVERRGLLKALRRRWFKSEGVKKPIFVGIPEKVEEVRNPFMIIPLSVFCTFVEFCRCCHCCDVHGFSSCSSLDLGSFHWPKPNLNGPLLV